MGRRRPASGGYAGAIDTDQTPNAAGK
jgi:hypothetical protein